MANSNGHLQQSKVNYRLLKKLAENLDSQFQHDWQVTLCFYVAVHLVNALLAKENEHPQTHSETLEAIVLLKSVSNPNDLYVIKSIYKSLKEYSQKARYLRPIKSKDPNQFKSAKYITGEELMNTLFLLNSLMDKLDAILPTFINDEFERINFHIKINNKISEIELDVLEGFTTQMKSRFRISFFQAI